MNQNDALSPGNPVELLKIDQPARGQGYRFSEDSLLVVAFAVERGLQGRALDAGSGVGVIGLLAASSGNFGEVCGLEIQDSLHGFALRNVAANRARLSCPLQVYLGDLRGWRARWEPRSFDAVLANPPFFPTGRARPSSEEGRRVARHEESLDMGALLEALGGLLKEEGRAVVLYPCSRETELGQRAAEGSLRVSALRRVRSSPGRAPYVTLFELCKMSPEPTSAEAPQGAIHAPCDSDSGLSRDGAVDIDERCLRGHDGETSPWLHPLAFRVHM